MSDQQWPTQQPFNTDQGINQPQYPQQPLTGYGPPQQPYPQQSPFNQGYQQQPSQPLPPSSYTQYPQQQSPPGFQPYPPQMPPPNQPFGHPSGPPPKKSRRGLWIAVGIIVLALVICGGVSNAMKESTGATPNTATTPTQAIQSNQNQATTAPQPTDTPTPAPTPTHAPKWTTIQTFTGNGIKKTGVFTVGDDWKISWSCTPSSFYGGQYNVQIYVYGSDGTITDVAVNTICKTGNTSDSTEEHQGGDVYLAMNSEGAWKVQIQELK